MKRRGILIILLFLIMTLFVDTKSVFAEDGKYKLEVNYGIDGSYKIGKYIPFQIKVTSEEDFIGEIGVKVKSNNNAGMYESYNKELSVEAGKSSTVLIPVNLKEGIGGSEIDLIDSKGKILATKKVSLNNGRVNEYTLSVGVLSEDKSSLGYLSSVKQNNSSGYVSTVKSLPLDLNYLQDLGLLIDGLDAIIVNNYNLANLNENNYKALSNWIEKGGSLIIGSGANEGKTIKNIDNNFLEVKTSGTKEETINILGEDLKLVNSKATIENSKAIYFGTEDEALAYSLSRGDGEIIVTSFDLGLEPFISSGISKDVMTKLLNKPFEKLNGNIQGNYNEDFYTINNLTKSIPVGEITSVKVVITIVAIYALIVGFVVYIVLKKLNKRDLTWIIIPVLSLIFTVIISLFGSSIKFKDIIINQNNIIKINEDGRGTLKGYIGISSKNKEEININNKENTLSLVEEDYYGYDEKAEYENLSVKTLFKEEGTEYIIGKSKSIDTTSLEVQGGEIIVDAINHELKMKDDSLNGSITNNFDQDIEHLFIILNNSVWDLGSVKSKETITLEKAVSSYQSNLEYYANFKFTEPYYNSRYNGQSEFNLKEYKNIYRKENLFRIGVLDKSLFGDSAKIIAMVDIPIDYELDFGNKEVSKFNSTLVVQDIEINLKNEDGLYNYPEGYFQGEYTHNNNEVYFDEYSNGLYGNGEAIINYNLDKNIKFEEVALSVGSGDVYNGQVTNAQTIGLYNLVTKEYDEISLTEEKNIISNLDNYLDENNKLEIKMEVYDQKGNTLMPSISAKGRDK